MRARHTYLTSLLAIASCIVNAGSALGEGSAPFIGYGSSNVVLTSKSQEAVYMGFEVGVEATAHKPVPKGWLVNENSENGTPLGSRRVAQHLIDSGAAMLVGFPTSYDALLAADVAKKANVLAIFRGCHSDLAKKGDLVFTADATMERLVVSDLDLIASIPGLKRGLMVTNPVNPASTNQEDEFIRMSKQPDFKGPDVYRTHLRQNLELTNDDLAKLKQGAYSYIYITAYADDARVMLQQMRDLGIDLPIIANPSWPSADIEYLRRLLIGRKSHTFATARWLPTTAAGQKLTKIVRSKYGREPSGEMAYGYDLGVIVGTLINRTKGDITRAKLIGAFKIDPCFDGLSNGKICFPATGGHAYAEQPFPAVEFAKKDGKLDWVRFTAK